MGYIEVTSINEDGVTTVPFDQIDIVTYSEILAALAAGDVKVWND